LVGTTDLRKKQPGARPAAKRAGDKQPLALLARELRGRGSDAPDRILARQ